VLKAIAEMNKNCP